MRLDGRRGSLATADDGIPGDHIFHSQIELYRVAPTSGSIQSAHDSIASGAMRDLLATGMRPVMVVGSNAFWIIKWHSARPSARLE